MTTKHTHPMLWGKREAGCPRCAELNAGAPVIQQPWRGRKARFEAQRDEHLKSHFASEKHLSGGCGPVCTFGDW